jgi:ribose transport system substrate-binding protein
MSHTSDSYLGYDSCTDMKKLAFLLFGAAILAGCNSASQNASASGTDGVPIRIAFVTNNASDFWTIARAGVEKAEQELGNVQVEFKIPADGTAAEQRRIVDDLLAAGIDGIAISPVDPANQTDLINQASKQTLVVTQDSDAPNSDRLAYVGTDNVAAGRQAGEELKKALPNGGKVMVFVGMRDAQNAKDRFAGLQEAVSGTNIEILDIRTDETDRARAKANVADTLVKHPDIAGLVGLWSYNGPAILNAVREARKVGQVKIVCFDEEDETLAGVKDGAIDATIVQQPYEFGYQSIMLLANAKAGKDDAVPANKLKIVDTLVIRRDDVDEFKTKLDQLRGR